jgi:putative endonuclease
MAGHSRPKDGIASLAYVPAIHVLFPMSMRGGWVYILSNKPNGILYVGGTSDLIQRVYRHREGATKGFSKTYGLKTLVYFEQYDDISLAIQREKTMKHWPRA